MKRLKAAAVQIAPDLFGSGTVDGNATAMMPGTITRNGKNIFGTAAMSGVRRAALIDSAAIARCTTRKSVHQ